MAAGRSASSWPRVKSTTRAETSDAMVIIESDALPLTSSSAAAEASAAERGTGWPAASAASDSAACLATVTTLSDTTSSAKTIPAKGALKPAATPLAAPAASSCRRKRRFCDTPESTPSTGASRSCSTQREVNMPHSTAGPSGPRLHPEPSVATAAAVRPIEASGRGRAPLVASATWPARFGPSPAGPHAARNAATARPPAPGRTKVYHGRMAASDAAIPNCTAGSPYSALATASTDALNVATPSPVSAPVSAAPPSRPANARSE
mmetsp:Transcript_14256/g.45656  ORF Transcript_14256/g.45656 Transcript_14256/m.45656 type:complete len:265 (+) Transcript_14256:450-1244(+)